MEVLQRTANRGSIATGAASYDIDNSLKFESDNAEYLYYTSSTQTDYQRMAFSVWLKRTELSTSQRIAEFGNGTSNTSNLRIGFDTSDRLFCYGNSIIFRQTNQVFRDTSAWYHLFFQFDTTQSTSNDRIKIWVNGSMIAHTDFGVIDNPSSGAAMGFNNGLQQSIGAQREDGPTGYFNGYMAQVYGSGGTPPSVTDFGEFDEDTGIWKPIDISELTPPDTQGFNLDFSDASNLGNDISSRNNNFTLQNITSADQATDTPTNNFCTINPLIPYYGSVSEGATKFLHTPSGDGWESFVATMGAGTSGKWYAEFKFVASGSVDNVIGICPIDDPDLNRGADHFALYGSNTSLDESVGYYAANGYRYIGGGGAAYGNTWAVTNIMSIAVDMDNGKLYFAKDGVWQNSGDPTSGATGTGALDVRGATKPQSLGASNYTSGQDILANYGGYTTISISTPETDENGYGTFEYAPPSGYYALCTKNLAEYG
jgi:hypothetical protein